MSDAANTAPKQRGRPFPKGVSGNPAGRPQGSRNRASIFAQELLDADVEQLVSKVKQLALDGDPQMLKVWMDRTVPTRREQQVDLNVRSEPRADVRKLSVQQLRDLEALLLLTVPSASSDEPIDGEALFTDQNRPLALQN